MSWNLKEKLKQQLALEKGANIYSPGSRSGFALIYPNTYHVGMSNLGFQIIYQQINSRGDTACERVFLPEKKIEQEYIRTNTPLMSLENQMPLYEFPLVGFAVTYEMDYFNILKALEMGKIPLLAADRQNGDPLIIIGGPCATFNPEPLADFVDVCIIGEGEQVIHDLLDTYYKARHNNATRQEILLQLANVPGIYVPSFYEPQYNEQGVISEFHKAQAVPASIKRRYVADLDAFPAQTVIFTKDTEFKDMFLLEIARGCGRHCRFCMAGYCYRRPRIRSIEKLLPAIETAKSICDRVGLMGAAISDYPYIDELCDIIREKKLGMSVASLRADTITPALMQALAESGHKTITLAPEAGSERLRRIINKGITDTHLFDAITLAIKQNNINIRLYIMIGLPWETEADVLAIVELAKRVKTHMRNLGGKGKLTLSINPFIPKPFTPFQWLPMERDEVIEWRLKLISKELKNEKGIEVLAENPKEAYIQGCLARADRRVGKALLQAHKLGGYKKWSKALQECGLDENFYLYRQREVTEELPWSLLEMGVNREYFVTELSNARQEVFTPQCAAGCKRCGVCI